MLDLKLLVIQICVILGTARLVGLAFGKINQPQVVAEMAAGILLGPSFLGWLFPHAANTLFPAESLGPLNALGQIGLLLFMFTVGLKLDFKILRSRAHTAVVISHTSIILPFCLGIVLATFLYTRLSNNQVKFAGFALFLGAAMSVTAFPVLARIIGEHKLISHQLRTITIACAAVDDVTAWLILAFILVLVRTPNGQTVVANLCFIVIYASIMIVGVRRLLRRVQDSYDSRGRLTEGVSAIILLLLLVSASTTEWLGIHTIFGAFLVGAIMPKGEKLVSELSQKFESVTVILFLPIFFALTGLRTSITLISGPRMWLYCTMIVLVAVIGKLGGSMIAARATGLSWHDAATLGTLMNTRGLMELVILNIGFEAGLISTTLYSMMVLMALLTTLMTSPILEWIYAPKASSSAALQDQPALG